MSKSRHPPKEVILISSDEEEELLPLPELSPPRYRQPVSLPPSSPPGRIKAQLSKDQKKSEAQERKRLKEQERKQRLEALESEKTLKRTENEIRRNAKPGEAQKFMTVMMDPQIPYLETLETIFTSAEIKYEISPNLVVQNAVTFKRELVHQAMGDDLKLRKVSKWVEEDQVFLVLESEELVSKLYCYIHLGDPSEMFVDDIDLMTFLQSVQLSCPGKYITLIIHGMEKYFRKMKTMTNREFLDRVRNGDQPKKKQGRKTKQLPVISMLEFQSSMVDLQLQTKITYRLVNNAEELGKLLTQYLKAIADAPFKRERKELGFDWFATADSCGSVKVEKDGQGLHALWLEQLQLFGNVGVDTAQAISNVYPSPKALLKKYDECEDVDEALDLLRNIPVWIGIGPMAKQRRIGPELSRKIYRFFTSTNGERSLGSSQNI